MLFLKYLLWPFILTSCASHVDHVAKGDTFVTSSKFDSMPSFLRARLDPVNSTVFSSLSKIIDATCVTFPFYSLLSI